MTFKELLKEKDMTASRLSRKIGVSKWTVGNWIHGNSSPQTAIVLYKVAQALEVDVQTVVNSLACSKAIKAV